MTKSLTTGTNLQPGEETIEKAVGKGSEPTQEKKRDKRVRPLPGPRDFDGVLNQMDSFAEDFFNRAENVWENDEHCLGAKLVDFTEADFTEERTSMVGGLASKLTKLAQVANRLGEEVTRIHQIFLDAWEKEKAQPTKLIQVIDTEEE